MFWTAVGAGVVGGVTTVVLAFAGLWAFVAWEDRQWAKTVNVEGQS